MSNNFDWTEAAADGDIVCHAQPETAVYTNTVGAACIRQRAEWPNEDDSIVIIQPENAPKIALAILQAAGFDGVELIRRVVGGYEDLDVGSSADTPPSKPKALTAAERKRRQRNRDRDNVTNVTADVTNVTEEIVTSTVTADLFDREADTSGAAL